MSYWKHLFIVLTLSVFLTACQNVSKDGDDDINLDETRDLTEAQAAFKRKDYQAAVKILLPLAQQGNPDAQYALGYCMYEGLGVPQDRMQSYFWIQEAALGGNSSALLALEIFEIDPTLPSDGEEEMSRHLNLHAYKPENTADQHYWVDKNEYHREVYPEEAYNNQYEAEYQSRQNP